jgi:hypothetical protein
MADRKRTVVVARLTVEVELDADAWAKLTKEERSEVQEEAENQVDQYLSALADSGFDAPLDGSGVELSWDCEEIGAAERDTRPA